jgi:hypothetical protein
VPSSEWNGVLLFEGKSFDKILEVYKAYIKKYGSHPKIPLAKLELLLSFEELGYPTYQLGQIQKALFPLSFFGSSARFFS